MKDEFRISPLWWLGVPVAFLVAQIGIELFVPEQYKPSLHSERGPHELVQSFCITAAFFVGLFTVFKLDWKENKLMTVWIGMATVCCLYVTGEELSWGQQILNWNTPAFWSAVNDQGETNLHNTSSWLDQKPRLILFAGIVVGGLIVPALRRWKPSMLPTQFESFYPSSLLIPSALGVLLPYTVQEIWEHVFKDNLFHRVSELQELYMYYFILLYLTQLRKQQISQ